MTWKSGQSGNPTGRPAGAKSRYVIAHVLDRLDEIGNDMRVIKKAFTYDQPPLSWAGDRRRTRDNGAPPDGSSLTVVTPAPFPEELRDGYSVEFRGDPQFEYFAEMVGGRFVVYQKNPGNGDDDWKPDTNSGREAFSSPKTFAPAQKGPVGSAQSEKPTGSAYSPNYLDAATRNKMAPRRHVTFAAPTRGPIADTLAKIRAADNDAKHRAADVAEFYARKNK